MCFGCKCSSSVGKGTLAQATGARSLVPVSSNTSYVTPSPSTEATSSSSLLGWCSYVRRLARVLVNCVELTSWQAVQLWMLRLLRRTLFLHASRGFRSFSFCLLRIQHQLSRAMW